ncbi:unnamed protein product [Psylliodes chrysocephalus]|uniref:Uncharacterized protein n=1 Tax=Psylliodes chrysocephalus TaxID=3402493 RepID=A0A9P0GBJ1_9CUCU|nr:unnamed protein product [Psylliodes chrysocephala]
MMLTDVKTFKYCPGGKIFYKLSYDDEYYVVVQTQIIQDLRELTSVLSKEVKDFYSSLPYQSEDKYQGNKKAKQETESDELENNQEIAMLKETISKRRVTNLKSTTKYKNKGNENAKQKNRIK